MEFGDHGTYMVAVPGRMECVKEPEIENATALPHLTEGNNALDHNIILSNAIPAHVVNYITFQANECFLTYMILSIICIYGDMQYKIF